MSNSDPILSFPLLTADQLVDDIVTLYPTSPIKTVAHFQNMDLVKQLYSILIEEGLGLTRDQLDQLDTPGYLLGYLRRLARMAGVSIPVSVWHCVAGHDVAQVVTIISGFVNCIKYIRDNRHAADKIVEEQLHLRKEQEALAKGIKELDAQISVECEMKKDELAKSTVLKKSIGIIRSKTGNLRDILASLKREEASLKEAVAAIALKTKRKEEEKAGLQAEVESVSQKIVDDPAQLKADISAKNDLGVEVKLEMEKTLKHISQLRCKCETRKHLLDTLSLDNGISEAVNNIEKLNNDLQSVTSEESRHNLAEQESALSKLKTNLVNKENETRMQTLRIDENNKRMQIFEKNANAEKSEINLSLSRKMEDLSTKSHQLKELKLTRVALKDSYNEKVAECRANTDAARAAMDDIHVQCLDAVHAGGDSHTE